MELINKQYALASAISGLVRTDENGEKWIRVKEVRESIMNVPTIEAEPQKAYEQGLKDALDKYDENFRIASEVRMAVGCNTAKECWELARNGDIQVVKHGRWIEDEYGIPHCSKCGTINNTVYRNYCPNCGARMEAEE